MAITPVQEIAITLGNGVTAVSKAFTANVTSGNLVVVSAGRYDGGANTAFVAGDCTKSAGTATIGTITLDKESHVATANPTQCAVWSIPVTGTGSLTIQVGGAAASFFFLVITEYSGTDVSASRVDGTPSSNTATTQTSPATTGNTTSTGDALFMAVLAADYNAAGLNPVAGNSFASLGTSTDGSANQTGAVARKIVTGAATTGGTWTVATTSMNGWAACIVAYKTAAGGGGRTFFLQSSLDGLSSAGPKQFNPSLG